VAEDWLIDVRKYAPHADEGVVAAIVRHCGIALRNRDSSLVSFTDSAETDRVRESYLKKKLGLTEPDSVLDAAIARVGEIMKADHTKNRVTVYYLLTEAFGKLSVFGGAAAPVAAPAAIPVAAAAPVAAAVAAAVVAAPVAATASYAAATPAAAAHDDRRQPVAAAVADGPYDPATDGTLLKWLAVALGGAVVLGILALMIRNSLFGGVEVVTTPPPVVAAAPAPVVAAPVIPTGAGVTAQDVEGKPEVSVYFDTAKTDVTPELAAIAAPVKAYVETHPGTRVSVSGYNDPRGDAAMNAELSKNRAKNVAAALVAIGIAAGIIDLDKPPETTEGVGNDEGARRVDIKVKDAL
jgi:outer membrane protein OmpA-like peptidoglycan-associated protein